MKAKASKEDFKNFVLDQLDALPGLFCKVMFGGYGLYQGTYFFGIIHQGRFYLKTQDTSHFVDGGYPMQVFQPNQIQTLKSHYEVPVEVLEDSEQLIEWAQRALLVAQKPTQKTE